MTIETAIALGSIKANLSQIAGSLSVLAIVAVVHLAIMVVRLGLHIKNVLYLRDGI